MTVVNIIMTKVENHMAHIEHDEREISGIKFGDSVEKGWLS